MRRYARQGDMDVTPYLVDVDQPLGRTLVTEAELTLRSSDVHFLSNFSGAFSVKGSTA